MDKIFCCSSIKPYRPQTLSHEAKFAAFMKHVDGLASSSSSFSDQILNPTSLNDNNPYVVQIVRQVNFGAIEWKKYFARSHDGDSFFEVNEKNLIEANFSKLNAYKNFKCTVHNRFFELNLYEEDPINAHHWRANIARPASEIDLPPVIVQTNIPKEPEVAVVGSSVDDGSLTGSISNINQASKMKTNVNPKDHQATSYGARREAATQADEEDAGGEEDEVNRDYYTRNNHSDYGNNSDEDGARDDFTACSADDCGYCGRCTY